MNTILEIKDLVIHYETDDGCVYALNGKFVDSSAVVGHAVGAHIFSECTLYTDGFAIVARVFAQVADLAQLGAGRQ